MNRCQSDSNYWVGFCLSLSLTIFTILYYPFPPGIDLPQHAHMLHMLTDYVLGREPLYRQYFELQLFTPYILSYLIALPFSALFGAVIAIKLLIIAATIMLVLGIRFWLISIRAEPWMSLTAFVTGFGYCFLWGFLPLYFSLGLGFFLLASANNYVRSGEHSPCRFTKMLFLGTLLSMCHAMGFTYFSILSALRANRLRRLKGILLSFVPGILFIFQWVCRKYSEETNFTSDTFAGSPSKIGALFGGLFSAYPSTNQMILGGILFASFACALRFRVPQKSGLLTAGLLGFIFFCIAPTSTFSTWLVAQRFSGILHILFPLFFCIPRFGARARYSEPIFLILILAFQLFFAVRVAGFNADLDGLRIVSKVIEPGSNIHSTVMRGDDSTAAFGGGSLAQTGAWVSAEKGRILENDSSNYIQMPLQQRSIARSTIKYRYTITRGKNYPEQLNAEASVLQGRAKLIAKSGPWAVYEILE